MAHNRTLLWSLQGRETYFSRADKLYLDKLYSRLSYIPLNPRTYNLCARQLYLKKKEVSTCTESDTLWYYPACSRRNDAPRGHCLATRRGRWPRSRLTQMRRQWHCFFGRCAMQLMSLDRLALSSPPGNFLTYPTFAQLPLAARICSLNGLHSSWAVSAF